tara:strand:- start:490183 stop:490551 length:369 start_codon:yes stop_codon:yes gene_type:complete
MATTTPEHDKRIAGMVFGEIYPLYLDRLVKNGRTEEELDEVIGWLTGFEPQEIQDLIDEGVTFKEFFKRAKMHPKAKEITGVVCGYRIEEIGTPLTRKCRQMEKLIDELARRRKMEKILRGS